MRNICMSLCTYITRMYVESSSLLIIITYHTGGGKFSR